MRSHSNLGSRKNFSARKPSLPPEEDKLSLYDKLCLDQFSYQNRPPDTRSLKKQPGFYSPRGALSPGLTNSPTQKKHVDIMDELDEIVAGLEASQSKIHEEKETDKNPVKIYEYKSPVRSSNRYGDNPKASMAAKVMSSTSNLHSSLLQDTSEYQLSSSYQQLSQPSYVQGPFPSFQTQQSRPERDLGDIFTSHEVWTTFEAAKHFHRKRLAGQIYPPVTYTLPCLAGQTPNPNCDASSSPPLTLPAGSPLPKILQKICRHPSFLPLQEPLLCALSAGGDVYLSAPHGSGRACVYRVLGLASVGFTVVLAKERRDARMAAHGVRRIDVPCLEEEVENGEKVEIGLRKVLEEKKCSFKFLFMAPGWPKITTGFHQALKENHQHKTVQRIVIYDVQSLSKLSSEYSETYLEFVSDVLKSFRIRDPLSEKSQLPAEVQHPLPQIFALSTETSRFVREDTMDFIGMNKTLFFCNSFWRPNHRHIVTERRQAEIEQIAAILYENYQGVSGLIYVNDFGSCERLKRGIMAELSTKTPKSTDIPFTIENFHHGLRDADRDKVLINFMTGATQVLIVYMDQVCMKWDKTDIRFTIHFHLPKSLHHYYTQSGVCGRDGNVADCILLYSSKDVNFFEDRSSHQQTQFSSMLKQQGITSSLILNNNDSGWTLGPNRFEFNEMVRYAEERIGCRKQFLCSVYGQVIKKDDCKAFCDNCSANFLPKASNKIGLVQKIVKFYASVAPSEVNQIVTASHHSRNPDLTPKQLVDVLKGTFTPTTSLQEQKLSKAQILFGISPDTDKKELEYVILLLLRSGLLKPQPQLSPQGPYTTLAIDSLYHGFYRPLLESAESQFVVKLSAKRRNQEPMEAFPVVWARSSPNSLASPARAGGEVSDKVGNSANNCGSAVTGVPVVLFEQGSSRFEIEQALSPGGEAVLRWVEQGEAGSAYLWRGPEDEIGRTGASTSLEPRATEYAITDNIQSQIVENEPKPCKPATAKIDQVQDVRLPEVDLKHVYDELDDIFEAFACKSSQRSAQDVASPSKTAQSKDNPTDESQLTRLLGLELQKRFELILESHSKIYNMQADFDPNIASELVGKKRLDEKKLVIRLKNGSVADTEMLQLKIIQEAQHFFRIYGLAKNSRGSPSKPNHKDLEKTIRLNKPPSGLSPAHAFPFNFKIEEFLKPPDLTASDKLYMSFLKLHQFCRLARPKVIDSNANSSQEKSCSEISKIVSEVNPSPFEEIFSLNLITAPADDNPISLSVPIEQNFVEEHHFKKKLVRPVLKFLETEDEEPSLGKRKPTVASPPPATLTSTTSPQSPILTEHSSPKINSSPSKSDFGVIVVGSDFPEHDYEETLPPLILSSKSHGVSASVIRVPQVALLPPLILTSPTTSQAPQMVANLSPHQKPKISTIRIISSPKKKMPPTGPTLEVQAPPPGHDLTPVAIHLPPKANAEGITNPESPGPLATVESVPHIIPAQPPNLQTPDQLDQRQEPSQPQREADQPISPSTAIQRLASALGHAPHLAAATGPTTTTTATAARQEEQTLQGAQTQVQVQVQAQTPAKAAVCESPQQTPSPGLSGASSPPANAWARDPTRLLN